MKKDESFVYLVESGEYLKIGISVDVDTRVQKFATTCPIRPTVIAVISGGRAKEKELHAQFKHLKARGEWFKNTIEIKSAFGMYDYTISDKEPEHGDLVVIIKGAGMGTVGEYDDDEGDAAVVYPHNRDDIGLNIEVSVRNIKVIERQ